jgi:hypothetical protein
VPGGTGSNFCACEINFGQCGHDCSSNTGPECRAGFREYGGKAHSGFASGSAAQLLCDFRRDRALQPTFKTFQMTTGALSVSLLFVAVHRMGAES